MMRSGTLVVVVVAVQQRDMPHPEPYLVVMSGDDDVTGHREMQAPTHAAGGNSQSAPLPEGRELPAGAAVELVLWVAARREESDVWCAGACT